MDTDTKIMIHLQRKLFSLPRPLKNSLQESSNKIIIQLGFGVPGSRFEPLPPAPAAALIAKVLCQLSPD